VSMGFSEALSDTGEYTGRGNPWERGAITGGGTFVGGVFHTLPFLISNYNAAIIAAIITVAIELVVLAVIRAKFFRTGFLRSFATVTLGGVIIVVVSAALGSAA
jgi:erythrin-vacuolar iron transport family protein